MNSISVLHINLFQAGKGISDFYFNRMREHLVLGHRHIEKPHRHDFYATILFTGGSGVHEIDFHQYEVSPGSLFFMSPGQVHSWELSDDIDGYIFFCSQDFYELHYVHQKLKGFPFFGSVSFPRKLQLDETELGAYIPLFKILEGEYLMPQFMNEALILSLMSQLFIRSSRLFSRKLEDEYPVLNASYFRHYQDFENFIEEHLTKQKSIAFYASLLNISPKHLNRITRTVVQKTATQVIMERVVLEAKRMLMYLDDSLVDIAFRLGYEEYSYFVRVFRKTSGLTPTQFIKLYKS
ncbi:AraC family transcriptional regulator [uncultured Chryseobacterium sp.]|uniref:helix-turn-helix domain-containing protein n=1 Tax=uncultured Chryseobacterium sp. TaxID=259322 RepID=UPI0025DE439F|nr:AraC family transcriptional regulator [uncultured Chryseobacterium sp.]